MSTHFSKRELEIAGLLMEMDIKSAAEELGISKSSVYTTLDRMRKKIQKAHNTVNVANNWKDSGKNPRLAKLLRSYE